MAHILLIFRTIRPNRNRAILHKFVPNYNYLPKKTTIISDMHHCITYMYIHFQQNLVSRLVKTVYTSLFAKHRELHKFVYYQIVILKNRLFQTCIIVWHTSMSIFSKIGLVDQPKSCTQMYFQKIISCINLQLPIVISNKSIIADIHHCITYMYLIFFSKIGL